MSCHRGSAGRHPGCGTCRRLERLASYHLDSPKFTKFNDSPPLERQDFATAMDAEVAEFGALDEIRGAFEDVKIDVFGAAAVVMVDDACDWKIAHEHLSVLPSPG